LRDSAPLRGGLPSRNPGATRRAAAAGASRRRVPALQTPVSTPYVSGRCGQCPGTDAGSVLGIDGLRPRPRMSLPARGNRFRRLRNRPARLLPAAVPACRRRAQAAGEGRSRVRRLRDQFVSGQESDPGRPFMIPDVTISPPFAGARLDYLPPDGVWGGCREGRLGGDRVLPREVFEPSHRTGGAVRRCLRSVTRRLTCGNRL
jgi:hypothetical protein